MDDHVAWVVHTVYTTEQFNCAVDKFMFFQITFPLLNTTLVLSSHRRTLEEQQGVKQITIEDALRRDDIKVAFVCTENAVHEENIR